MERTGGNLEWSDSSIRFSRGDSFFEWNGSFSYEDNGDIKNGSIVNEFERRIDGSYGRILVSGISYDAVSEFGAFYSLTIPNEIRDILENLGTGGYSNQNIYSDAYPGWSYKFETIYDSETKDAPSNTLDPVSIGRLYTAAFGRKPDAGGLQYWINQVNDPLVSYKTYQENLLIQPNFQALPHQIHRMMTLQQLFTKTYFAEHQTHQDLATGQINLILDCRIVLMC